MCTCMYVYVNVYVYVYVCVCECVRVCVCMYMCMCICIATKGSYTAVCSNRPAADRLRFKQSSHVSPRWLTA